MPGLPLLFVSGCGCGTLTSCALLSLDGAGLPPWGFATARCQPHGQHWLSLCSSSAGAVSSIIQVQLIVLCSRYDRYETAPPGCNITFANISLASASSSSSSSASSPSSSSSPSSPSPASLDGTGSTLGPLAESPAPEAASPGQPPNSASQSSVAGQRVSFSGTVAFERPVVGAQSLQSLAGMMYSGGVTNGRCAHADDGACICYFTLALMRGEHLLAGMMYSPGMSNDRCSHQHDYACAEIFVVVLRSLWL